MNFFFKSGLFIVLSLSFAFIGFVFVLLAGIFIPEVKETWILIFLPVLVSGALLRREIFRKTDSPSILQADRFYTILKNIFCVNLFIIIAGGVVLCLGVHPRYLFEWLLGAGGIGSVTGTLFGIFRPQRPDFPEARLCTLWGILIEILIFFALFPCL